MPKTNRIRIGTAGWTIPRESSAHFPDGGTHLQKYSTTLNCAEINSSFYRHHKTQTWEKWANAVPAQFRFAVKAPKAITHEAALECESKMLKDFFDQLKGLGTKLGPVLFQLPPKLQFDSARAKNFFYLLRAQFSGEVVCEPRHVSWFDRPANDLLDSFRIARVAADPACVEAASNPGGWPGLIYYRLHGSPRRYYSAYDSRFLGNIATKAFASTAKCWCIFDNTASGAAMKNALELRKLTSPERFGVRQTSRNFCKRP